MKLAQQTYEAPKVLQSQKVVFETKVSGMKKVNGNGGLGGGNGGGNHGGGHH
jgi:hypothetical protein